MSRASGTLKFFDILYSGTCGLKFLARPLIMIKATEESLNLMAWVRSNVYVSSDRQKGQRK